HCLLDDTSVVLHFLLGFRGSNVVSSDLHTGSKRPTALLYFCPMDFKEKLHHLIDEALKEDIGDGDHSTLSCIDPAARGKALLKIKQEGILAGVEVAKE